MKFIERCDSGLRKIVSETVKLPGYSEEMPPVFLSSATDFRVELKNVNVRVQTESKFSELGFNIALFH